VTDEQLDELAPEPLHHQLQRIFTAKIEAGTWPVGHQLEAEVTLSQRYGVSRATMRQAILSLVSKGYLTRKQGRGTFVAQRKLDFSVVPAPVASGAHARHELLGIDIWLRDPEAAETLGVPASTTLTRIDRLRYEKDEPVALERTYQPSSTCPGIEKADLSRTLTEIMQQDYATRIGRYNATVEPVLLDEVQQEQLRYTADPALGLLVTRTSFTVAGEPLILGLMTFRGDRCRALFTNPPLDYAGVL
jgi:DNA-binding GntR family transcriptional regulator